MTLTLVNYSLSSIICGLKHRKVDVRWDSLLDLTFLLVCAIFGQDNGASEGETHAIKVVVNWCPIYTNMGNPT